jgi:LPS sulfotransferase NodH
MENEIFNPGFRRPGASFDTILAEWLVAYPRAVRAVGCKVFYDHLDDAEWSRLLARPDLRVIHLRRRNGLRMFLSLVIAEQNDHWIEDRPHKRLALERRRVEIQIPRLVRFLELSAKREEEAGSRLAGRPVLDVAYEDMRDDLGGVMTRVLQFVGARSYDATRVNLGRQNPEPAHSLIRNYVQVVRALETSRWRQFLVED